MKCSCAIDFYEGDFEPVSLVKVKIRKARKQHSCTECERVIAAGERYENTSYLYEGVFFNCKMCVDCLSAKDQFFPSNGYCTGGMWEDIAQEVNCADGEIPEACISELTETARGKLCDMIDNHLLTGQLRC